MARVVSCLDLALTSQPGTLRVPWGEAWSSALLPDPHPITEGEGAPVWVLTQAANHDRARDGDQHSATPEDAGLHRQGYREHLGGATCDYEVTTYPKVSDVSAKRVRPSIMDTSLLVLQCVAKR